MRLTVLIAVVFCVQYFNAQQSASKEVDSLYKEDQFYIGVTYNLLGTKPSNVSQSGFSLGLHMGFIKDMPINKRRNMAIGLGMGYSANSFNQNMLISKDNAGNVSYTILEGNDTYTKNRFTMHLVEMPIEFRWRTSTAKEYKFWRIYLGFKLGYLFANIAKHKGDLGSFNYNNVQTFNNIQYGLTLSVGYNTWNFYFYYALNPIFSSEAKLNTETIDMNAVKVGLMFYIL